MIIRLQDFQAKKHRRCPERIIKLSSLVYIFILGKKKENDEVVQNSHPRRNGVAAVVNYPIEFQFSSA